MGFFSWKTSDTNRSIANKYSEMTTFEVHMITPDGRTFTEADYEGYGEFGGKDFYELLAELNGKETREDGIDLAFKGNPNGDNTPGVIYPKFVQHLKPDVKALYEEVENSPSCPDQGYFYSFEEEVDEWEGFKKIF